MGGRIIVKICARLCSHLTFMPSTNPHLNFNNPTQFIEGWYWALPSKKLKIGKVKAITLLGKNLAIYRGVSGQVVAIDAYCPHMGAHFAEGKVEGDGIRCFFHNWKYDSGGICVDVPSLENHYLCVLKLGIRRNSTAWFGFGWEKKSLFTAFCTRTRTGRL